MRRTLLLALAIGAVAAAPASGWKVALTQIDKVGTMVGNQQELDCPAEGCQRMIQLELDGKPYPFLAVVTFVNRGAYVTLRPDAPAVGKVVGFEEGFEGPIFIPLRQDNRVSRTLNFTVTGPAVAQSDAASAQLMQNSHSLVFHRKLAPDLTVRVDIASAGG
jgi:hypothetical protein